jgi:hypothetical protein
MITVGGEIREQLTGQDDTHCLLYQRVTGTVNLDDLTFFREKPLKRCKPVISLAKSSLNSNLFCLPTPTQVPDIGIVILLPSPGAEPVVRGIDNPQKKLHRL